VSGENYLPLDFCSDITKPDVSTQINETVICLEADLSCYTPLFVIDENSTVGTLQIKCLWGWCYAVNETFNANNNKTLKTNNFPAVL